jgi:hypothetical protein
MARSLLFLSIIVVVFVAATGIGFPAQLVHSSLIVGGQYSLPAGQTTENLTVLFANLTVPDDAVLDGSLLSFSSNVDVRGSITDGVRAIESDINFRETAQVDGQINEKDFIHWILLLPNIVCLP